MRLDDPREEHALMSAFMVICTFRDGTDMTEVMSVVEAEQVEAA